MGKALGATRFDDRQSTLNGRMNTTENQALFEHSETWADAGGWRGGWASLTTPRGVKSGLFCLVRKGGSWQVPFHELCQFSTSHVERTKGTYRGFARVFLRGCRQCFERRRSHGAGCHSGGFWAPGPRAGHDGHEYVRRYLGWGLELERSALLAA